MKKTNIIYWTSTGLFSAFMLMSGIQNLMVTPEWVALLKTIGYPSYLLAFLGVAKCLGVVALLVPGYPRIREWAYAGFFFDILGAAYSIIMIEGFQLPQTFMLVLIIVMGISYIYHHKRLGQHVVQPVRQGSTVAA